MRTARSADGTPIAFDRDGDGQALILVSGALRDRAATSPLATALAPHFTVYNYDRRGRGASGDTAPYRVEREIEDFGAVLAEAGGSAFVYGHSSGAALALGAAARGLAITKLAVYEPPYVVTEVLCRQRVALEAAVGALIEAGRRADAVERFLIDGAQLRPEVVAILRASRMWPPMEALADTLRYDLAVMAGGSIPAARLASIGVPTLFLDGSESPRWARDSVRAAASVVPAARHISLAGQDHSVAEGVIAPLLVSYFATPGTTAGPAGPGCRH
jgi:pimeloyl-ACP methyl ester carboxylesterase